MKLFLVILVALFCQHSTIASVEDLFLHRIAHNLNFRCFGILLINNDIIVPATCLNMTNSSHLQVGYANGMYRSPVGFNMNQYFNFSNPNQGNVARLYFPSGGFVTIPTHNYTGRDISRLSSQTTNCAIHSLTEGEYLNQTMMQVPVIVSPPSECGNDSPYTFCTFVSPSEVENVCKFKLGSPLICDGSNIAGFVISDGGCEIRGSRTIMRYNSISIYEDWMEYGFTAPTTLFPMTTPRNNNTTTGSAVQKELAIISIIFVIFSMILIAFFCQIALIASVEVRFIFGFAHNEKFRCFGTLLINNDIIVPATCLNMTDSSHLQIVFGNGLHISPINYDINQYFNSSNPHKRNIGRVYFSKTSNVFVKTHNYTGRDISRIPSRSTYCAIHSLTEGEYLNQTMMQVPVIVSPPSECGNDSPYTFCTFVSPSEVENVCKFKLGSPLICDGSNIAGIVISDGGCEIRGGRTIMRYNSISIYEDWMKFNVPTTLLTNTTATSNNLIITADATVQIKLALVSVIFVTFTMILSM
ncbi:hypothetical protein PVAND_006023 [Polypedilum vanderplanki]|uniref:Peptidase S1 domain-containing protein n=1 Tax=Polypedilum vanderplanki TaxID=319348 RepID=A0A9J6C3Q7_POLVA|nr:hypothetical protein PVAND_006023 [Polypedilum vanderplanki]